MHLCNNLKYENVHVSYPLALFGCRGGSANVKAVCVEVSGFVAEPVEQLS